MGSLQCPLRQASRLRTASVFSQTCLNSTASTSNTRPQTWISSPPVTNSFSTTAAPAKRDPGGQRRFGERSSYQVRHPRYYRGPLHPHQPPHPSDPASREFVPGPFTSERLWDHYNDTVRADLLTLSYTHLPPGYQPRKYGNRLRKWEGDSPYIANRPLRGPRGHSELPLVNRPMTFRNVPRLESIVVHSFIQFATKDATAVQVGGMALQAITGVRAEVAMARQTIGDWNLSRGKPVGVKARLEGPAMYRFLASCVEVVMPKIKEYQGVAPTTGDLSGNISFGFAPEIVALFPEIEVNYDMYPPRFIPGINVTCLTTATNDRDARLLLSGFGIPFKGEPKQR